MRPPSPQRCHALASQMMYPTADVPHVGASYRADGVHAEVCGRRKALRGVPRRGATCSSSTISARCITTRASSQTRSDPRCAARSLVSQSGSIRSSITFFGRASTEPTLCSIRHAGHAMCRRLLFPVGGADARQCCRKHLSPAIHAWQHWTRVIHATQTSTISNTARPSTPAGRGAHRRCGRTSA